METPIEGLYVAGNITGIESSKVASAQGTLAGVSMAKEKADAPADLNKQVQRAMEDVKQTRADASIQFHPGIDEGRTKVHDAFKRKIGRASCRERVLKKGAEGTRRATNALAAQQ